VYCGPITWGGRTDRCGR